MDKRFKLIRCRLLLPLDEKIGLETRIEDGYVLTENDLIREVGAFSREAAERIIRDHGGELRVIGAAAEGKPTAGAIPMLDAVVLPGFVKGHGHDHESPIIGVAKDEPLTAWLDHAVNAFTGFLLEKGDELKSVFGASPHLITYAKARLDDIYYGITSALTHHCNFNKYNIADLIEANLRAGTRIVIAVGSQDRNYDPRILDTPAKAVGRLEEYRSRFQGVERVKIIPGPDQVFSNSEEMLRALKQWSLDHDTLMHIHSSEEPATTRWFYRKYKMSPVQQLHRAGVLDKNAILAHQVNNTPIDLEILEATGAAVIHNPLANTILGSGMPPIIEMMERGIPVAVSTDGSGSADNQDMIAAARLASQYQKARRRDAKVLPAQKVLEMVTVVPAKILRINAGSLAPGRSADLIAVDLSRPNLTPTRKDNVIENLIWAADGSEVRWVIASGRILKDDYRFVTLDEAKLKEQVLKLSEMMMEYKAGLAEVRVTGARSEEGPAGT